MAAHFDTVATIVTDVGLELGLGTLTAAYPTTNATLAQMQALLKATGRRLVRENDWLQNLKDYTFTTDGSARYVMPDGFLRMEDGTGWNRTTRQPLRPVSPQEWEALQATNILNAMPVLFRPSRQGGSGNSSAAAIEPLVESDGETIALQYWTDLWLATSAGAVPTLAEPAAADNIVRIDPHLFSRALKMDWLRAKGFDSTAAQQDYEAALDAARADNRVTSPTLSLNGPRVLADRLLSNANIPETGYGS